MIKVYASEIDSGLKDTIQKNNTIAAIGHKISSALFPKEIKVQEKIIASVNELFHTTKSSLSDPDIKINHSILVSSVWNKNDEVFLKSELIKAKDTPVLKRVNLEHNEKEICGVMVATCIVDDDGNVLDDEAAMSDDVDVVHILNSSAVYTFWEDEEFAKRVNAVLDKIESNEQFVSMECLFSDFDYAVTDESGKCTIVKRNEQTAFLSASLRAYGGSGTYENYKVGRVPRNLVFSGIGFVDKPANPDSVTFTNEKLLDFITASESDNLPNLNNSGVSINREDTQEVSIPTENNEQMTIETLQQEKATLESSVATLNTEVSQLKAQVEATEKVNTTLKAEVEELNTKLATVTEEKNSIAAEYKKVQDEIKVQARVNSLVAAGLTVEDAQANVEKFAYATDEQFAEISKLIVSANTKATEPKEEPKSEPDAKTEEQNADASALESAQATETEVTTIPNSSEQEQTEIEKARAGLHNFAKAVFSNKK